MTPEVEAELRQEIEALRESVPTDLEFREWWGSGCEGEDILNYMRGVHGMIPRTP
jgi:hypothetical protein